MNPDTRVAICCYQGDAHQVLELMPFYQHHECPITILSPEDSPVLLPAPLDCRMGGKRCYIGWDGIERMKAHLRILINETSENFFLINDADSFCITPELPAYLYAEPDVLWTSVFPNDIPEQQPGFAEGMPHVAFHPPWFLSRGVIEKLLAVGDDVQPNEFLPFIDYWMLEAAVKAGITWKSFEQSMSLPTNSDPACAQRALEMASQGAKFYHSVKTGAFAGRLLNAYTSLGRNWETVVSVHCYDGDRHQVEGNLPAYVHHQGSKVVVISPTNSTVVIPGVDNIHAGHVGYIGQVSLDRQLAQMQALLTSYPDHKFFLLNDADSVVLDPMIPTYLYEEDVVWSNTVVDGVPNREPFPHGWPTLAFQPPYFVSRRTLEKLVEAGLSGNPLVKATGSRPFIDFYMLQLTMVAGLPWKRMKDALSWPISINQQTHPNPSPQQIEMYDHGYRLAVDAVRNEGGTIVHSVKDGETTAELLDLRRQFKEDHPGWTPNDRRAPVVGNPALRRNHRHPATQAGANIDAARRQRAILVQQQRARFTGNKA
jgi:hypothetical protein